MNSEAPQGRRYLPWMLALAGLFSLRVGAQLVQAAYEVPSLPPFEAWQGSGLPYPALLASQAGILVVMAVVLVRVKADAIAPRPWKHRTCFVLGGVYFTVMAFRLFAGLTLLTEHSWFAAGLPAFFHVVLATFILTLGHYVYRRGTEEAASSLRQAASGARRD